MIIDAKKLLNAKFCDRCGCELGPRTVSNMNTDIICPRCAEEETHHPDYLLALKAMRKEFKKGNKNYPGLFAGQKYPFGR